MWVIRDFDERFVCPKCGVTLEMHSFRLFPARCPCCHFKFEEGDTRSTGCRVGLSIVTIPLIIWASSTFELPWYVGPSLWLAMNIAMAMIVKVDEHAPIPRKVWQRKFAGKTGGGQAKQR